MKRANILLTAALTPLMLLASAVDGRVGLHNLSFHQAGNRLEVSLDMVLDSLDLPGRKQLYVTPVVTDGKGNSAAMPAVLINGRNMHIAYERGTLRNSAKRHDITTEIERHNGTQQAVHYMGSVGYADWMMSNAAGIRLNVDTCGCGADLGTGAGPKIPLNLNPAPQMRLCYLTPQVTELPITKHEGRARVQFEVDKTDLHAEPYTCKNGQRIDNRAQLQVIDDSVRYALTDPNVEIAGIHITGYASPESPYLHNEYLATNRSKALADYLAAKYHLPADRSHYDAVAENWGEFRQQVVESKTLSAQQRADLLALIDRPAYGPADYDQKEKELKTSPKFAALYRSTILPQWFPELRATKFAIHTRLKPLSDEQLREVLKSNPGMMSLNQMFRVARLYPEGSPEFNEVISTALHYYPNSPDANLNAAVERLNVLKADADTPEALAPVAMLLEKAGDSPEAWNARGVLLTRQGKFAEAAEAFRKAGALPEAVKNLGML